MGTLGTGSHTRAVFHSSMIDISLLLLPYYTLIMLPQMMNARTRNCTVNYWYIIIVAVAWPPEPAVRIIVNPLDYLRFVTSTLKAEDLR